VLGKHGDFFFNDRIDIDEKIGEYKNVQIYTLSLPEETVNE